jgi:hypothetical protein
VRACSDSHRAAPLSPCELARTRTVQRPSARASLLAPCAATALHQAANLAPGEQPRTVRGGGGGSGGSGGGSGSGVSAALPGVRRR